VFICIEGNTAMWFAKNLPLWERLLRLFMASGMLFCAWVLRANPVGWALAMGGVAAVLTALVGYCPACALAGRRLLNKGE
jgi:hypothetical protein